MLQLTQLSVNHIDAVKRLNLTHVVVLSPNFTSRNFNMKSLSLTGRSFCKKKKKRQVNEQLFCDKVKLQALTMMWFYLHNITEGDSCSKYQVKM